jgi:SAM-dependent methyltransferase
MPSNQSIRSFWNKAAEENPYWFVSSFGPYNATRNLEEFWASGRAIWADIKRESAYIPTAKDMVVEIGCGVGRLTRTIAPEVGRVIAIDISERMLAIAREANLPNVDFRNAEGFSLPGIPDGSADLALAYCVFQHLPSHSALESYLREMHRVTKPGGLIAFTLGPRDWKTWLLPVLRARAYLRETFTNTGPKGVYRKEWVGIRPSASEVSRISPILLERQSLDAGRILYFGQVGLRARQT